MNRRVSMRRDFPVAELHGEVFGAVAMKKTNHDDLKLLSEFVACFGRWDELTLWRNPELATSELATGEEDEIGTKLWRPLRFGTPPAALDSLYKVLPARLPRLYERLVLSYRWAAVDLQRYSLLANPPGPDLSGLLQAMSKDPGLWEALLPAGYIPFGRGPDMDYDPVCFDFRRGHSDQDCRIVKIDHEEILCHYRVKEVAELAPTFRELVWQTIEAAAKA
jgi:hypothetical protein